MEQNVVKKIMTALTSKNSLPDFGKTLLAALRADVPQKCLGKHRMKITYILIKKNLKKKSKKM